jgi:hypothetical protein
MKPFRSIDEMIDTHELMFGAAGRFCAEAVCRHVTLFDEPLNPLWIRVVLAPIELGPYNRHYGYTSLPPREAAGNTFRLILGNRHICKLDRDGSIVLLDQIETEDFIVHELTHHRQDILLACNPKQNQTRGVHRDPGWYGAIAEAAPRYLEMAFPQTIWPKLKSKRTGVTVMKINDPTRLTEVEACHWPHSFRSLIAAQDKRIASIKAEYEDSLAIVLHT